VEVVLEPQAAMTATTMAGTMGSPVARRSRTQRTTTTTRRSPDRTPRVTAAIVGDELTS